VFPINLPGWHGQGEIAAGKMKVSSSALPINVKEMVAKMLEGKHEEDGEGDTTDEEGDDESIWAEE